MKHYAGLDVSVKETAVCIVDENGGAPAQTTCAQLRLSICERPLRAEDV